ncbi:1ecbcb59-2daf-41cf-8dbb-91009580e478-CDS [Sclerotinia trifoliorum]|uniref:1ecbcb59-2daf-41cf-8dbb-91009580e478-CDS n=1 Tax=Sclerotinia trifoliorum TaxID=28548 RepID=A0A8H2ZVV1_9HELO|nr:1ecbcb59-2daf-41cf-8dbb-91009580e478-CDS [Sclerotinia trifoliorum]
MANYKEISEACSLLLFFYVTVNLIGDAIIISLIALITGKSLWEASQIYKERCEEIYKWPPSFLRIEGEEKDQDKETTINAEDAPEALEAVESPNYSLNTVEIFLGELEKHVMELFNDFDEIIYQAAMVRRQQQSAEVKEAREPLKTPASKSAPPVVSSTVSSLLSAITDETNNVSGGTWRLFYSDTVYKRDNSLRLEWKTKEKYEAWLRKNGWIAITEEEIETLERWKGWALAFPENGEDSDWEDEEEEEWVQICGRREGSRGV